MKMAKLVLLSTFWLLCGIADGFAAEVMQQQEASKTATALETEKYVNNNTKYSFEYPAKWEKKEIPKLDLVLFVPPKDPAMPTHASMNAVSESIGTEITLDQFYNESVSNLTSQLKDVNIETSGKLSFNGVPVKWILYTHVMQGVTFRVLQYFVVAKTNIYLLTFSSVADDFANYRPDFEKIASTFTLLGDASSSSHTPTQDKNY